ncbi:MAG: hypothetical protein ING19_08965, partial [Azospirillum sp.]|nr:hypothetical protein [Azospirillum sp.]
MLFDIFEATLDRPREKAAARFAIGQPELRQFADAVRRQMMRENRGDIPPSRKTEKHRDIDSEDEAKLQKIGMRHGMDLSKRGAFGAAKSGDRKIAAGRDGQMHFHVASRNFDTQLTAFSAHARRRPAPCGSRRIRTGRFPVRNPKRA